MKEHPILFSTDMVRAILDGRKTVTRRVMSKGNSGCGSFPYSGLDLSKAINDGKTTHAPKLDDDGSLHRIYPKLRVGDRLWVRETWREKYDHGEYIYRADEGREHYDGRIRWRPSIFMPRAASRITLEVVSVTAERLQDITEEDAIAEGVVPELPPCIESPQRFPNGFENWSESEKEQFYTSCATGNYIAHVKVAESLTARYANLWDSLYAQCGFGWDANPWVWRNGFKVLEVKG